MKIPHNYSALEQINASARGHKNRWENLVVIGIGGSSLGITMLSDALCHPYHNFLDRELRNFSPRLFIIDNIDPEALSGLKTIIDPEKTLVCIVTKSGGTVETWGNFFQYLSIFDYKPKEDQIVAITDEEEGFLNKFAKIHGCPILPIPKDIGGRFSVLTPVGLFTAAMMNIDITRIIEGARNMHDSCINMDFENNPALQIAAITWFLLTRKKKVISVMMPYSNALRSFSDWYGQLWAESLGKRTSLSGATVFAGQTPVQALGATDQHSQIQLYREGPNDKLISFIAVESFRFGGPMHKAPEGTPLEHLRFLDTAEVLNIELSGTREILTQSHRPNLTVTLPAVTPYYMGQLIYLYEMTTLYTAILLNINPLDQPGIEAGKQYVRDSIEKVYLARTGDA
ncbi:glucose-6-phosphate isomerase [bacterium]|nr:glucose-6-phosphate isomerase [candidate division CSSED10-310 bacterium]